MEYPEKNPSEQRINPHVTPSLGIEPGPIAPGGECSHHSRVIYAPLKGKV